MQIGCVDVDVWRQPEPNHVTAKGNRESIPALNPLTPNDHYSGRTAPLTSKRCILYIYSTNTCNECFKHGIYSPFFPLQNAVCFIILTYLVPVLFTFYIQGVLNLKKNNSGAKRSIVPSMASFTKQPILLNLFSWYIDDASLSLCVLHDACTQFFKSHQRSRPITNNLMASLFLIGIHGCKYRPGHKLTWCFIYASWPSPGKCCNRAINEDKSPCLKHQCQFYQKNLHSSLLTCCVILSFLWLFVSSWFRSKNCS